MTLQFDQFNFAPYLSLNLVFHFVIDEMYLTGKKGVATTIEMRSYLGVWQCSPQLSELLMGARDFH